MSRTLAAILSLSLCACSFVARGYRAASSSTCSRSHIPPAADAALALVGAGAAAYGFRHNVTRDQDDERSKIMGPGFAGMLVFATSTIAGFTWAGDCRHEPQGSTTAAR